MDTINLSPVHKYNVESTKQGGMGSVYIITKDKSCPSNFEDRILLQSEFMMDEFKYLYRDKLAAKTIKSEEFHDQFLRELNIWISFSENGSVPLLKIIKDQNHLFGIMPYYPSNLRDVIHAADITSIKILKNLIPCLETLNNIYNKLSIVHLDIKPENILVGKSNNKYYFKISDWGISNIITKSLVKKKLHRTKDIETIIGAGTLPYMSPERWVFSKPKLTSDIFSFGIMFYEILFGNLPYSADIDLKEQILSGSYFNIIVSNLKQVSNSKIEELIINMTHPDESSRLNNYKTIIKILNKI